TPMWPAQPTITATANVAVHTATAHRGGRAPQSAHAASSVAPAKNVPVRTFAALADRIASATYGYVRSTGQPRVSGRSLARRRRLQKKIERSTVPATL